MATLKSLKEDIDFHDQLGSLLNVLKSIAAQQFQLLERKFQSNELFFDALAVIAGTFDVENLQHPFTGGEGPVGVIAVTSDMGLLGGLNQQVIAEAAAEYEQNPGKFMVIGRKGAMGASERKITYKEYPGVQDDTRRQLATEVANYAMNEVLQGRLGRLTIVYPRALSFTHQRVELIRAVPCHEWLRELKVARGVRGGKILMESSLGDVLEYIVWMWVHQQMFEVLGMARLAEMGARAAHLEGSTDEIKRRKGQLKQKFNRQRREVIDRSLRELVAGRIIHAQ